MGIHTPLNAPEAEKKLFEGFEYDFTMTELDKEFYADLDGEVGDFPFLEKYELDERLLHQKHYGMSDAWNKIPALKYMDIFVRSIEDNDIVLVQGGTGMGKTVGIARALKLLGKKGFVNVPKREIATGVSNYIYKQFGQARFDGKRHGQGVGHMVRGNSNANAHTDVVYLTDAIGIKKVTEMVENNTIDGKVIVIDEFHERNQNMDILLLSLLKARSQGHKFKIVIMSATINTAHILRHFEKQFAIKEQRAYANQITRVGLLKFPSLRKHEIYIKTGDPEQEIPALAQYVQHLCKKSTKSGEQFLVFRQGKRAIQEAIMDIQDELAELGLSQHVDVVPMYGSMDQEDLEKSKQVSKRPKIIVSTNMLGSGVTLDNLARVSTNCKVKRKVVRNDFEQLLEVTLSQDEILQELGRGGRTKPSVAFLPDIGEGEKGFSLQNHEKFAKPEIQRLKPSSLLFTLANNGLQHDRQDLLDAPLPKDMEAAKKELILLGLIDDNLKPTELGEQVDEMGLDYRIGVALLEAKKYGKEKEMVALLACQQVGLKPKGEENARFDKAFVDPRSEALTQYNVYKSISSQTAQLRKKLRDIETQMLDIKEFDNTHRAERLIKQLNRERKDLSRNLSAVLQQHKVGFMQRQNLVAVMYTYRKALEHVYADPLPKPQDMTEEDILLTCLFKGNVDKIRVENRNIAGETHENAPREKRSGKLKIADGTIYHDYKKGGQHRQLTNVNVLDIRHLLLAYPEHFSKGKEEYVFNAERQKVIKEIQRLFLGLHTDTIEDSDIAEIKAVHKFAQTIYQNRYIKWSESAKQLRMGDVLKEINEKNKLIIQQLNSLYIKTNRSDKTVSDETFLSHWYCDLLYRHKVYSTQAFEEFLSNNPNLLELDSIEHIFPDYQKTNKKYPDTVVFNGKELSVKYSREWGYTNGKSVPVYTATLSLLSDEDIETMTQEYLDNLLPDKKITLETKSATTGRQETITDIAVYKEKLITAKKDKVRNDYIASHQDTTIHALETNNNETLIVTEEVVDEKLGVIAYWGFDRQNEGYIRKIYKTRSDAERDTSYVNEHITNIQQEKNRKKTIIEQLPAAREEYNFLKQFFEQQEGENRDASDYLYYAEQKLPKVSDSDFIPQDYDDAMYYLNKLWGMHDTYQRNTLSMSFAQLKESIDRIAGYKKTQTFKNLERKRDRCMQVCDWNQDYEEGETYETIKGYIKQLEEAMPIMQKEIQGTVSSIELDYASKKSQYSSLIDRLAALEKESEQMFKGDNELRELLRGFFTIDYQKRHQHEGRGGGGGRRDSEQNDPRVRTLPCRIFPAIELCDKDTLAIVQSNLSILEHIIEEYENYEPEGDENTAIDRNAPLEEQLKGLVDLFKK